MNNKVNCNNVSVRKSIIADGDGAFAEKDFLPNEIVETGIVRVIPIDGHKCPYVFTWSDSFDKFAMGSGCSTFYNASSKPNCKMVRDFENNTFQIIAIKEIKKNDELTHLYKGINHRKCFKDLGICTFS